MFSSSILIFPPCFLLSSPSLVLPLCSSQKANCRLQSSGKVSNCNSLLRALSSRFGLRYYFFSFLFCLFCPPTMHPKGVQEQFPSRGFVIFFGPSIQRIFFFVTLFVSLPCIQKVSKSNSLIKALPVAFPNFFA